MASGWGAWGCGASGCVAWGGGATAGAEEAGGTGALVAVALVGDVEEAAVGATVVVLPGVDP
ncbi:hypothetical protein [Nocardia jiangxiensis]|uniref:hypothetical protein n=1 Tax=Nocardia jiangxiensis TaxID=282685 RepID=UPI0002F70344|nr:hypothetical protein [Nocardia jiangxiensis]